MHEVEEKMIQGTADDDEVLCGQPVRIGGEMAAGEDVADAGGEDEHGEV